MTNKKSILIIVIIAVALLAFWWWSARQAVEAPPDAGDINQELEGLDVNNLDDEFQQIDQDLDTL